MVWVAWVVCEGVHQEPVSSEEVEDGFRKWYRLLPRCWAKATVLCPLVLAEVVEILE